MPKKAPKMLTMAQWATAIGVSRAMAQKYLNAGRVPGAKLIDVDDQPRPVWRIPATAGKPEGRPIPGRPKKETPAQPTAKRRLSKKRTKSD